jgi:hypothetical protein
MAMDKEDRFKNENKVRKVGGRVESDYYHFRSEIEYINDNFFELFYILNLTDDIDLIIDTLNKDLRNLYSVFIDKVFRDIEAGKIRKNKFLSGNAKKRLENTPPEEQEKVWKKGTKWGLNNLYKKILEQYQKEYGGYWLKPRHNKSALEILRTTLFITPERIEIDGEKFVEVYTDYLAADESETKKIHEQTAEAINRFFNGAFPITQKELSKYFILEYGTVKVNPKSVNLTDYARLGARTIRKAKKDRGKKK